MKLYWVLYRRVIIAIVVATFLLASLLWFWYHGLGTPGTVPKATPVTKKPPTASGTEQTYEVSRTKAIVKASKQPVLHTLRIRAIDVNSSLGIEVPVDVDFLNGTVKTYETPIELKLSENTTIVVVPIKQLLTDRYINVTYKHGGAIYRLKYVYNGTDIKLTIVQDTDIELKYVEKLWGVYLEIFPSYLNTTSVSSPELLVTVRSVGGYRGNVTVRTNSGFFLTIELKTLGKVVNLVLSESEEVLLKCLPDLSEFGRHKIVITAVGTGNVSARAFSIIEVFATPPKKYLEQARKSMIKDLETSYRRIDIPDVKIDDVVIHEAWVVKWDDTAKIECKGRKIIIYPKPGAKGSSICFNFSRPLYKPRITIKVTFVVSKKLENPREYIYGFYLCFLYGIDPKTGVPIGGYPAGAGLYPNTEYIIVHDLYTHRYAKVLGGDYRERPRGNPLTILYPYVQYLEVEIEWFGGYPPVIPDYLVLEIVSIEEGS